MIREHKGYFVVELYDPDSRRKFHVRPADYDRPTPTTEEEARELEALAKLWGAASSGPMSVRKYADMYCERKFNIAGHELAPQTNDHNRKRLKKFVEQFGPRPMQSISRAEALAFARDPETMSSAKEVRGMFTNALADQTISDNPFAGVKVVTRKNPPKAFLREADIDRLAQAAREVHGEWGKVFAAWIEFTAWIGARPGETAGAQWAQYDEANRLYNIQLQYHGTQRKLLPPKHNSTGVVHVFEKAAEAVADLPRTSEFMFPTTTGKLMDSPALARAFKPVKNAAGLPDATPGALRHFLASYMLNELALPPYTIAQQLRHRDGGKLIVQTYGHPDREMHLARIAQAEVAGGTMGEPGDEGAAI